MTSYSRSERTALCDMFDQLGPDAPTLCAGWTAQDLAAHLFVRERRPLAAPGILLAPLSKLVDHSMTAARQRHGFADLVMTLRSGPPLWSPFRYLDEQLNLLEYFVHHEDVRRAQPDWQPREIDAGEQDALWHRLAAMLRLRSSKGPDGINLAREGSADTLRLRAGVPAATVVGAPSELVLYAYGRKAVSQVEQHADPEAVADNNDTPPSS